MGAHSNGQAITDLASSMGDRLQELKHPRPGVPTVVEVEVNSRCNRRCSYCPVKHLPKPDTPVYMADEVFESLLDQLALMEFDGRFSYHLYNEPLLRADLESMVALTKERLPNARQILYTNGDRLTDERYEALLESGIAEFLVTRHDSDQYPDRPAQSVITRDDIVLTNRGGAVAEASGGLPMPCHAPSEMLIVTSSGDVLLCYEDARRRNVMGNILEEPLAGIWNSPRFESLRAALVSGERQCTELCRDCDNTAHGEAGTSWFAL